MCGGMSRGMRCDGHRGRTSKSNGSSPIDSFKITPIIVAIVCATKGNGASMDGTAAQHEADEILAELPDRISDVVKPFARHSPDPVDSENCARTLVCRVARDQQRVARRIRRFRQL